MLVVGATGASRQGLQLRIESQLLNPKPKMNANKLGTSIYSIISLFPIS